MAYKLKGYKAHDNMKTLPKDLSGRSSANQRTPQIKPGKSPGKLRMANPNTGIDEVWNANSNISQGMGNLASSATQNIYQNQNNTGFTNNPMLNSKAGKVGQHGGYGDFYGGGGNKISRKNIFNSKAALEAAGGRRAVSAGMTRDLSERATKGTGSIQDMINSTVSSVQAAQDAKRQKGLTKYKADAAAATAKRQAENDARFNQYKTSSESKYNKLKGSYDKLTAAQKANLAKKRDSRRRRSGIAGAVGSVIGGATKSVGKAAGGIVKGLSRALGGIFGRRRRRRRRRKSAPATKPKTTTTTANPYFNAVNGGGAKPTPAARASANRKKVTTKKRRRRRRRRWFSDIRLKQNIRLIGSSNNGIPIYNFSYIGDNTIYQGAMAQDLISMGYNSAVTKDNKSGYYVVDYDQIDVDMIKI